MKKSIIGIIVFLFANVIFFTCQTSQNQQEKKEEIVEEKKFRIQLEHDSIAKSISVKIDNQPFTSYLYTDSLLKTVLYPIQTPKGTLITRGYPIAPRPYEYTDHPHHIGHWFSYGSVNEIDFWNNSSAILADQKIKYGVIKHQKINRLVNSDNKAVLGVELHWITHDNITLLVENSIFTFAMLDSNTWYFDRVISLYAPNGEVRMYDNKEGMFAVRVAHQLEHLTKRPEYAIDMNGQPTSQPVIYNENVTGKYTNSNGIVGDEVWGKRADWVKLTGKIGNENITIAILNNKQNVGGQAYWHARGYGLFAVNNLGHRIFTQGKEDYNYALLQGGRVNFRYRFIVNSNTGLSDEFLQKQHDSFSNSTD
jgi:hypothetical protein